ncbi:MAG TPA: YlxR family protein [Candidatus Dormibacteraeota bacterium]
MPKHQPDPSPPAGEGGDAAQRHSRVGTRTCVACRQEAGKGDLIRLVRRPDGSVEIDPGGRLSGRGAYVHATSECVEMARKRRSLERALGGASIPPEVWAEVSNSS